MPVINWMDLHCQIQYVDMITEPGADRILVNGTQDEINSIRRRLQFSLEGHQSNAIAIVGHHDCFANPVSHEEHLSFIKQSAQIIESWEYWVRVVGLYVNEWSAIDVIYDTEEVQENQTMRSFL